MFDLLAETIIPELIKGRQPDQPIRIWIAGCSTGEETYSLAMIFQEQITAARSDVKLQVFASDVDADAVARAREGLYPETIANDVSADALARFFSKDDRGYKIVPELRAQVIFTVQDVLERSAIFPYRPCILPKSADLPAARRSGEGHLAVSFRVAGGRYSAARSFRNPRRHRRGIRSDFKAGATLPAYRPTSRWANPVVYRTSRERRQARTGAGANTAERCWPRLCRQMVLDTHAPAAVLINRNLECLWTLGPIDHFLRVAPGVATHDLLAMAHEDIRTKLRSAIPRANQTNARTMIPGGRTSHDGRQISFDIDIQPVTSEGEALLLICFVNEAEQEPTKRPSGQSGEAPDSTMLEKELEATRAELEGAVRALEISNDEQRAINEEALSVQEEFQSTNEELLTSKEELQSLNEELTALNSQLQETLEKQRTTANDLQNVLYSTDVATIFLDSNLNIRFFTPATRSLFNVIPGDIGRPLVGS